MGFIVGFCRVVIANFMGDYSPCFFTLGDNCVSEKMFGGVVVECTTRVTTCFRPE